MLPNLQDHRFREWNYVDIGSLDYGLALTLLRTAVLDIEVKVEMPLQVSSVKWILSLCKLRV